MAAKTGAATGGRRYSPGSDNPLRPMSAICLLNAVHAAAVGAFARCRRLAAVAGLLLALLSPGAAGAADVLIFAAASTTDAVAEIGKLAAREGLPRIVASFASSSALAKQIANGAPADIYLSANVRWMEYLDRRGAIDRDSRVNLLGNSLVLVAPRGGRMATSRAGGVIGGDYPLAANLAGGRLAIGNPDHVPAGIYGKQALVALGLWPSVEKRLAPAANVRAALALVERGEAEAGIVYATDAAIVADKVAVIGTFPASSHMPIIYPAAIVAGRDRQAVRRVFAFLTSAPAAAVFARYGFRPLAAKP